MKISPTQFFFFTFHISSCFLGYIYIVLYIYVRQTIVLHSLYLFTIYSAWHSGIHSSYVCWWRQYLYVSMQNGVSSPLVILGSSGGTRGAMWWWRGMHTPQSHALCCGSCGQHRLYHQTSRLGANQSSSANCRGIKGERKQHACFTMMLVPFMMTNWRTQLRSFPISRIKFIKPWSKITPTISGTN